MPQQVFHSPWINQQSPCKLKFVKKDYISFICPQKFPLYTKKNETVFLLLRRSFYFGFKPNKIIFKEILNKLFIMLVNVWGNIA